MLSFIKKLFPSKHEKDINSIQPLVEEINAKFEEFDNLTDEQLRAKTAEFKEGDAIIEVVKLKHNGTNHGKVPVKLVVFYLGAKDVSNVIRADRP